MSSATDRPNTLLAASRIEEDSRRGTPTLPPGLAIPPDATRFLALGRESGFGTHDGAADTPIFSGLGVSPEPAAIRPTDLSPTKSTERKLSSARFPRPPAEPAEVEVKVSSPAPAFPAQEVPDESSFPALPKSTARIATVASSKKAVKAPATVRAHDLNEIRLGKEAKGNENIKATTSAAADLGSLKPGSARLSSTETTQSKAEPAKIEPSKLEPEITKTEVRAPANVGTPPPKAKRQHPGKLEIPAASKQITAVDQVVSAQLQHSKPGTPVQRERELLASPSTVSRSQTPVLPSETPIKRSTQPRTIRVLATPKAETPTLSAAASFIPTPVSAPKPSPGASMQPSRRTSLVSLTIPGTPASEKISDNHSVTTDSFSRTGSPPPSRVGSAPVRAKTKSQQKKERQDRARTGAEETIEAELTPFTDSVTQAPIVGRKKKTKKPAAVATAGSTPSGSRPETPVSQAKAKERKVVEIPSAILPAEFAVNPPPAPPPPPPPAPPIVEAAVLPTPQMAPSPPPVEQQKKPASLPASMIAELEASGELEIAALDFFKSVVGLNHRHDITIADISTTRQPQLTAQETAQLDAGQPIRRGGADGRASSRMLITPSRICLCGLTLDMEDRYLEIERRVASSKPPFKYHHRRDPDAAARLMVEEILKDVAAALTQPPNTTTTATTSALSNNDPASGGSAPIYGDDSLAYLNQFILPPLPSRGKPGDPNPATSPYSAVGVGIPRTYTTGDPTYSVFGVDIGTNRSGAQDGSIAGGGVAGFADRAAAFSRLGVDAGTTDPVAIKKALASAVNGVVAAAAAVAGVNNGATVAGVSAGLVGLNFGDEDVEGQYLASRRECEGLEKRLAGLIKKNRRVAGL